MPPGGIGGVFSFSGISVTNASVVSNSPVGTLAESCFLSTRESLPAEVQILPINRQAREGESPISAYFTWGSETTTQLLFLWLDIVQFWKGRRFQVIPN